MMQQSRPNSDLLQASKYISAKSFPATGNLRAKAPAASSFVLHTVALQGSDSAVLFGAKKKKRKTVTDGVAPGTRPSNVERIQPSESDMEPVINTVRKNEDDASERPRSWWKKEG